jgi:ABC-type polysaccharide/polyol phosphate transport system ATPase subunit
MASILLENVTLDFPIYESIRSFKRDFLQKAGGLIKHDQSHPKRVVVRSLDNISLKVGHGDRIGLIGHNGAGKSTLLRVLAGVYEPVSGRLVTQGHVSPLFNTSPGMVIDDTGYENIFTCGLFLGMSKREIEKKVDDIAEFTELGEYLYLPVRTYSSGMLTRLGFAIATAIDPEILLLDEGLGAGDARFTEKASRRISSLVERSSILVLATHSDGLIRDMCNKACLMDHGKLLEIGPVEKILAAYHELTQTKNRPN